MMKIRSNILKFLTAILLIAIFPSFAYAACITNADGSGSYSGAGFNTNFSGANLSAIDPDNLINYTGFDYDSAATGFDDSTTAADAICELGYATILSGTVCVVKNVFMSSMFKVYCSIAIPWASVATKAFLLYWIFYFIAVTFGLAGKTGKEIIINVFKTTILFTLITNPDEFYFWIYQTFNDALGTYMDIIITEDISTGTGVAYTGTVTAEDKQTDIFMYMDILFEEIVAPTSSLIIMAVFLIAGFFSFGVGWFFSILVFTGLAAAFMAFLRMVKSFITALMSLTFILMFAPIFLTFLFFEPTKPLFNKWMGSVISYTLQPIIIIAFLFVVGQAMSASSFFSNLNSTVGLEKYDWVVEVPYIGVTFVFPFQMWRMQMPEYDTSILIWENTNINLRNAEHPDATCIAGYAAACMQYAADGTTTPGADPNFDEPHETCVKNCSIWWMLLRLMAFLLVWIMLSMITSTFLGHIPKIVQELVRFEGSSTAPVLFGKSQSFDDSTSETQDTTSLGDGKKGPGGLGSRFTSGKGTESAVYSRGLIDAMGLAGSVFRGATNDGKKVNAAAASHRLKRLKKQSQSRDKDGNIVIVNTDKKSGTKTRKVYDKDTGKLKKTSAFDKSFDFKKARATKGNNSYSDLTGAVKEESKSSAQIAAQALGIAAASSASKYIGKNSGSKGKRNKNMIFQNRNVQEKSVGRKAIEHPAVQYTAGATKRLAKDIANNGLNEAASKRFNARYKYKTRKEKTAEREALLLKATSTDKNGNKVVVTRDKRTGKKTRYIFDKNTEKLISKKTFGSKEDYAKQVKDHQEINTAMQGKNYVGRKVAKQATKEKQAARKYTTDPAKAAMAAAASAAQNISSHGDKKARINRNFEKSKNRGNVTLQKAQSQESKLSTDKDGNKIVITRNKKTGVKTRYIFDKNTDKLIKKSTFTAQTERDETQNKKPPKPFKMKGNSKTAKMQRKMADKAQENIDKRHAKKPQKNKDTRVDKIEHKNTNPKESNNDDDNDDSANRRSIPKEQNKQQRENERLSKSKFSSEKQNRQKENDEFFDELNKRHNIGKKTKENKDKDKGFEYGDD